MASNTQTRTRLGSKPVCSATCSTNADEAPVATQTAARRPPPFSLPSLSRPPLLARFSVANKTAPSNHACIRPLLHPQARRLPSPSHRLRPAPSSAPLTLAIALPAPCAHFLLIVDAILRSHILAHTQDSVRIQALNARYLVLIISRPPARSPHARRRIFLWLANAALARCMSFTFLPAHAHPSTPLRMLSRPHGCVSTRFSRASTRALRVAYPLVYSFVPSHQFR
jgi:hypothetical protein